jgi:hypothetical protein
MILVMLARRRIDGNRFRCCAVASGRGKARSWARECNSTPVHRGRSSPLRRGLKGRKSLASLAALAAKSSSVARGDGVQYGAVDKSSNGGGALIVVGAQSIVLATRKLQQQQKQSNLIEPSSIQRSSKQDSGEHAFTRL